MRDGDPINAVAPTNRSNPQDDNTRFTAVNNASNGNAATIVVGHNRTGLGPIAVSPRTAARSLEDWQDNSTDHPQKRKRTPDPTTGLQQHSNPYPQHQPQQNPQTPRQQQTHPQLQTAGSESGAAMEESINPKHHSMEGSYSEQGKAGSEPKHGDLRELRMVEGSPQTPTHEGCEQKKRKRQFANRTKTGCITCRRRKKKCDEGKPECTNCKRGGFVCEGYTNKISWPKVPVRSTQLIQSKDVNPSASASPSPGAAPSVLTTPGHLLLAGDQYSASTLSPQQRPAIIEKSFAASTPPPGGQPQSAQQTTVQQQQPQEFGLPRTPTFVTSGPLVPSPRAASPGLSGPYGGGEVTDKQKMLSGQWYYGSSPELMAERERCKQACYRFNNALMLNASKAEQWRLFVETLRPGGQYEGMPGGIVNKIDVETPFHCNYGTNISLGEEVRIGPGCSIIDAAPVTIKARSILDGDVKIYTTIRRQDPRRRMGAKGQESAKPVVIEEDCWIGGNVTILPGVTIGRGSVVGAGSVVGKDVPPYTVASGNPAVVLSGVYNNGAGM